MSEQSANNQALRDQIAALQAQLQAGEEPTPTEPVQQVIPSPEPVAVSVTPAVDYPAAAVLTPIAGGANGDTVSLADYRALQAQVARLADLIRMNVVPGPGAVATEPGSPAEAAMQKALDSGALAHIDGITRDGVHTKLFVYADGSVRPA